MKYQNRVRLGQNKISHLFLNGSDLGNREQEVLKDASRRLNFSPEKLLDRSPWWNSKEIGAFRYVGKFEGKKRVLKIQGVKPSTSEIYMIQSFAKANQSKILRPPLLYAYLPWDDEKRYEALVLECVEGEPVVSSPTCESQLREFFKLRQEYKKNCVINPWIEKPRESLSEEIQLNFAKWREASFKLYPVHPFRKKEDEKLIDETVNILIENYKDVGREFQHGHFGTSDLLKTKNGQVVILSNLYWSWKPPFYDAVFGYHWFIQHLCNAQWKKGAGFIYHLAKLKNATPELVEQQKNLWLSKINNLAKTHSDKKLLNLAFWERAAAGLNLDALSVNPKSPSAEYLVESTRENLKKILKFEASQHPVLFCI